MSRYAGEQSNHHCSSFVLKPFSTCGAILFRIASVVPLHDSCLSYLSHRLYGLLLFDAVAHELQKGDTSCSSKVYSTKQIVY